MDIDIMFSKKCLYLVLMVLPFNLYAHSGKLDKNLGHSNKKSDSYHYHNSRGDEPIIPVYNRSDWHHWVDTDRDCQNTRAEVLILYSTVQVLFRNDRNCVVDKGEWYGVYTGHTFSKASDLDIDHIVALSHAHKTGAAFWNKQQKKMFANDTLNLLPVDDSTNISKGDKGPVEWKPMRKYWRVYAKKWIY